MLDGSFFYARSSRIFEGSFALREMFVLANAPSGCSVGMIPRCQILHYAATRLDDGLAQSRLAGDRAAHAKICAGSSYVVSWLAKPFKLSRQNRTCMRVLVSLDRLLGAAR